MSCLMYVLMNLKLFQMSSKVEKMETESPKKGASTKVVAVKESSAAMPDIKLFGKWNLEDVQLSDMSLSVS